MKKIISVIIAIIGILGCFYYFSNKDPYHQKQAITQLDCLKDENIPEIESLGKGLVLVCSDQFDEESGKSISKICIVDIMKDEIIKSMQMNGSYSIKYADQEKIILTNNEKNQFEIYDQEFKNKNVIKVKELSGCIKDDQYYYLDQGALYVLDINTEKSELVKVEDNIRFSEISEISDHYLICHPYINTLFNDSCVGLLDLNTGSFEIMNNQYQELELNGSFQLLKGYNVKKNNYDYTFCIDDQYYDLSESALSQKTDYFYYVPNSQYLFDLGEMSEGESDNAQSILYLLDKTIKVCDLKDYGYDNGLYSAIYLKEENLIVGYDKNIVIVDPSYLKLEDKLDVKKKDINLVDKNIIENYNIELKSKVTGLKKAQSKVKELEEMYDVQIMISTQCKNEIINNCGFKYKDTSYLKDEERFILEALNDLEIALKKYPEGFFKQFKTKAGDGGLDIYLVGEIKSTYSVIAFEFDSNYRQNIAIDIINSNVGETFCHEVWHAIENIALCEKPDLFDDWNDLNPKGFKYEGDYENYEEAQNANQYTYYGEDNIKNVYFIDSYSRTYASEDRARIVEYFMGKDEEFVKELKKSSHIMEKVKKINETISEVFEINFQIN